MAKAPEVIIEWEKGEIAKLNLEEGDTVVVRVPARVMRDDVAIRYMTGLMEQAFKGHKVLIIPKDVEVSISFFTTEKAHLIHVLPSSIISIFFIFALFAFLAWDLSLAIFP